MPLFWASYFPSIREGAWIRGAPTLSQCSYNPGTPVLEASKNVTQRPAPTLFCSAPYPGCSVVPCSKTAWSSRRRLGFVQETAPHTTCCLCSLLEVPHHCISARRVSGGHPNSLSNFRTPVCHKAKTSYTGN